MTRDDTWWLPRERVTVVDVLESGACIKGVAKWLLGHGDGSG
jgi:hypothetical protein